jgi:hypothetical protein
MANIKISELTAGGTLGGSEYVPIVQNGATVKTTVQAIANLGGGGGAVATFTPELIFEESGIGSNSWTATDGQTTMTAYGTYTATAGEKVTVNASNNLRLSFPIAGSYYAFGIKFKVDPNFSPINTTNWFQASCILGQELGGEQKDFGIVIDKDGYISLGWGNSTITPSDVSALDGNVHFCIVAAETGKIHLFIDGVEKVVVNKGMINNEMDILGVFWNKSGDSTRVNGEIYAVGYWLEHEPTITYILQTL